MASYTFTKRHQLVNRPKRTGIKLIISFTSVLAFLTLVIQLGVMSQFATKGQDIAKLEQNKEVLIIENKKLSKDIADARSLQYVKTKSQNLGFVDIKQSEVKYIDISGN